MPPSNTAAWQTDKGVKPVQIKTAPYTKPGKNEIVIKTRAIAFNIFDAMLQLMGPMFAGWVKYPFIFGCDVAGEVYEVGPGVTRFKPGDRVLGNAISTDKHSNRPAEGGFQEYVVLREHMTSTIPDSLTFENACVLPLTVSTAASGLFQKDYLNLRHPSVKNSRNSTGETVLVWGGSTSLGANAIQLAVAAGYEVIATASPKNFEYVKSLGASQAFDYRSPTAVRDIIAAFKGKKSAGAIAIGDGSLEACIDIVGAVGGKKFVSQASMPRPKNMPPKGLDFVSFVAGFLWFSITTSIKARLRGVSSKFIWGTDLVGNEVGAAIYEHFLPDALASGKYVAAPQPKVIGHGLESVQAGMDTVLKGVSTEKIVITI